MDNDDGTCVREHRRRAEKMRPLDIMFRFGKRVITAREFMQIDRYSLTMQREMAVGVGARQIR
jgi:hypothetical protein